MVVNGTKRVRVRYRANSLCMHEKVKKDTRVIRDRDLKNRREASINILCTD